MTAILLKVVDHGADVFVMQAGHDQYLLEDGRVDGWFDFLPQYAFHGNLPTGDAMHTPTDGGECSAF